MSTNRSITLFKRMLWCIILPIQLLLLMPLPAADNWPGWRGDGSGVSPDSNTVTKWDSTTNIRWQVKIPGKGHSSPIIWDDYIFLTAAEKVKNDKNYKKYLHAAILLITIFLAITAYLNFRRNAAINGSDSIFQRLKKEWLKLALIVILLASQVLLYKFQVFDTSVRLKVLALNRLSGETLWERLCIEDKTIAIHPDNSLATPTPVTDGQHVYANFGSFGNYCFTMAGETVWQSREQLAPLRWGFSSSPVLSKRLYITVYDTDTTSYIFAFDKFTGEQRWQHSYLNSNMQHGSSYSSPFVWINDSDPQIIHHSSYEIRSYSPETGELIWEQVFKERRSYTSPIIVGNALIVNRGGNQPPHIMERFLLEKNGDSWNISSEWQQKKMIASISSPLVHQNRIYSVTTNGIATARALADGKLIWKKRLSRGKYYASITAAGHWLYFANLDGAVTVMKAGDQAEIVAVNYLDEALFASPAISRGEIFIRGDEHLYCIGEK